MRNAVGDAVNQLLIGPIYSWGNSYNCSTKRASQKQNLILVRLIQSGRLNCRTENTNSFLLCVSNSHSHPTHQSTFPKSKMRILFAQGSARAGAVVFRQHLLCVAPLSLLPLYFGTLTRTPILRPYPRTKPSQAKANDLQIDNSRSLTNFCPLLPKLDDPRSLAGSVPFSGLVMPAPPWPNIPEKPPRRWSPRPPPSNRPEPPSAPRIQNIGAIPQSPRPAQLEPAAQNEPGCLSRSHAGCCPCSPPKGNGRKCNKEKAVPPLAQCHAASPAPAANEDEKPPDPDSAANLPQRYARAWASSWRSTRLDQLFA